MSGSLPAKRLTLRAQPAAAPPAAGSLYAEHVKIYPRAVQGRYRSLKWALLLVCLGLYYTMPWIRWDRGPGAPDQALLIDMTAPRAYFFNVEIWPQEVYFLTGLLVLGAIALFLVTALFGRLWCGYACPQTVWTDLFMLVERWIEGDRGARIRLDHEPLSLNKALRKTGKHAAWLLIALATGGAWALYFNDAPQFVVAFLSGIATATQYFFVGLFTTTTYVLAGWAREQVCIYMCPWPRFQAAMLDSQSLVVSYQAWRGEQRGMSKAGPPPAGKGDCIDCGQCVAVCPTGIDIRDGLQLECIGCGLCIDACNDIMTRLSRPDHLIRFDTEANLLARTDGGRVPWQPIRPRTLVYATALLLVSAIMLAGLLTRTTLEINVLRDRAPLFVTLSGGDIRNGYTLKILNKRREELDFLLSATGIPGLALQVQNAVPTAAGAPALLHAEPDTVATFRIFLTAPRSSLNAASLPVHLHLQEAGSGDSDQYDAVFIGPPITNPNATSREPGT
jgi:cytochrome c oxidase accessory protein FixG